MLIVANRKLIKLKTRTPVSKKGPRAYKKVPKTLKTRTRYCNKNDEKMRGTTWKLSPGTPSVEDDVSSHALAASPRPLARTTRNENEDETKPIFRFGAVATRTNSLP